MSRPVVHAWLRPIEILVPTIGFVTLPARYPGYTNYSGMYVCATMEPLIVKLAIVGNLFNCSVRVYKQRRCVAMV